jgi:cysteine dioxygenase
MLGNVFNFQHKISFLLDSLGLHRVENPSHTDKAVSLHLYSPPFDICHWFDERTSKKHTCKITFTSKAENGTVDCCK